MNSDSQGYLLMPYLSITQHKITLIGFLSFFSLCLDIHSLYSAKTSTLFCFNIIWASRTIFHQRVTLATAPSYPLLLWHIHILLWYSFYLFFYIIFWGFFFLLQPLKWEYIWLLGSLASFLGLTAIRKNRIMLLQVGHNHVAHLYCRLYVCIVCIW